MTQVKIASWQQTHTITFGQVSSPFTINRNFTNPVIVVRALCKSDQHYAGLLYPILNLRGVGLVRGIPEKIYLQTQLVKFLETGGLPYFLEFVLAKTLPAINLTFWENKNMPSYPADNIVGATASTSSTVPVTDTTAAKVLAANPLRKKAIFYNPDAKTTVYLGKNQNTTANLPAYPILPGKVYVDDQNWAGDFYAIATKGGNVQLNVEELS